MVGFSCHVCGGTAAKAEFVSEIFTIEGRRALVEHIPAQVCDPARLPRGRCGEPTFSRETTETVRQLVHNARPAKTVPLDVFALV